MSDESNVEDEKLRHNIQPGMEAAPLKLQTTTQGVSDNDKDIKEEVE